MDSTRPAVDVNPFKPLVESFIGFKAEVEAKSKAKQEHAGMQIADLESDLVRTEASRQGYIANQQAMVDHVDTLWDRYWELDKDYKMVKKTLAKHHMLKHRVVALKSKARRQKRKLDELVRDNLDLSEQCFVRPAPWVIEHGARIS